MQPLLNGQMGIGRTYLILATRGLLVGTRFGSTKNLEIGL